MGNIVFERINHATDLPAADALYHQVCNVNFRTFRNIPLKYATNMSSKQGSLGRPVDESKSAAFFETLDWLENNEDEIITIQMLWEKMKEYTMVDDEPYSRRYMKQKLKDHYGDDVIFTEDTGKETLVTLQNKVGLIIDNFYKSARSSSPDNEKNRIIQTAAHLIREDIKLMSNVYVKDEYPHTNTMDFGHAEREVTQSLKYTMGLLIPGKEQSMRRMSIAHALMQAAFPPKLTMLLQLGLAVRLYDKFASRYLMDFLYSMGFSKSYKIVRRYKKNAALIFNDHDLKINETQKMYFMADNVDHNPANLDGMNTVHWMGMTLAISPVGPGNPRIIPRLEVSKGQVMNLTSNMVHTFNTEGIKTLGGLAYRELKVDVNNDNHNHLDLL